MREEFTEMVLRHQERALELFKKRMNVIHGGNNLEKVLGTTIKGVETALKLAAYHAVGLEEDEEEIKKMAAELGLDGKMREYRNGNIVEIDIGMEDNNSPSAAEQAGGGGKGSMSKGKGKSGPDNTSPSAGPGPRSSQHPRDPEQPLNPLTTKILYQTLASFSSDLHSEIRTRTVEQIRKRQIERRSALTRIVDRKIGVEMAQLELESRDGIIGSKDQHLQRIHDDMLRALQACGSI